jgi:hypothetical protein
MTDRTTSTYARDPPVTERTATPRRTVDRRIQWLCVGALLVLAAALRLWTIRDVPGNVFYDAAVRSMGTSWHAFFFGALEPSGTVSIDKPPVDLWLQVASTHVLGFGLVGLHLPEALGGVVACGLLFGALWRPFGFGAALAAALALAVLPVSVLTARSDTMDSVLAALEVGALWLSWRALESGRMRYSVLAAALMGAAFNVKLGEMLIALPAMALLWLWAAAPGARLRTVAATTVTFLAVALSWTAIAALTPTGERPFPIGSANGSIWHVTLVYNGLDRLSGHGATGAAEGGAGPLRLLSAGPMQYWSLLGVVLLATSLLGLAALGVLLTQGRDRLRDTLHGAPGRFGVGIVVWFSMGLVAFSAMDRLQVRYLEAFAPAVCAVLGISLSVLWRGVSGWRGVPDSPGLSPSRGAQDLRGLPDSQGLPDSHGMPNAEGLPDSQGMPNAQGLPDSQGMPNAQGLPDSHGMPDAQAAQGSRGILAMRVLLGCVALALLVASLSKDAYVIHRARTDSLLTDYSTPSLSRYLHAHREGARYEVASANVNDVVGLIARDGRPVLMLNSVDGPLTRTPQLQVQVADGRVLFYFDPHACHGGRHCPSNEVWAYAHSAPVPHQSSLRRFAAGVASAPALLSSSAAR